MDVDDVPYLGSDSNLGIDRNQHTSDNANGTLKGFRENKWHIVVQTSAHHDYVNATKPSSRSVSLDGLRQIGNGYPGIN